MRSLTILTSTFVTLSNNDIDTDQIIPARFLKGTDKKGLGQKLFHDWRYLADGSADKSFILNQPHASEAGILVVGDNFGCGSSREHAPWALLDFGFHAIISSRFADIFCNNALKNGLLPVAVDKPVLNKLFASPAGAKLTIDLTHQVLVLPDETRVIFPIDPFNKTCLLEGLDTLDYLLKHQVQIEAYEKNHPAAVRT